jgi:hypothetical protein
MDSETGRIYEPQEYSDRKSRRIADAHQAAFERQEALGKIVEVSETVARQVQTGQRVDARRLKRKAAKAARRANR